jgi:hypothetical protein
MQHSFHLKQAACGLAAVWICGAAKLPAAVLTLDNTDPGYSETGAWNGWVGEGSEGGGFRFTGSGSGATATWSFSGVPAGRYLLSASTVPGGDRTTTASYTVTDGIGTLGPVSQNGGDKADFSREIGGVDNTGGGLYYTRLSNTAFAVSDGTLEATVSAPNGVLIADAFRLESVRPDVLAVFVIDNENAYYNNGTYTKTGGTWGAYGADVGDHRWQFDYGTSADATASYAFTGLPNGTYRVSSTWSGGGNRPGDARYYVEGGPTITVNQTIASSGDLFEDVLWDDLFNVVVTDGTLTVNLENLAGGFGGNALISDAVRLELIPEPASASLFLASILVAASRRRRA